MGAEARTASVTEGDQELLTQEQVLRDEALAASEGAGQGSDAEPEEFDHRGRIADRRHLAGQDRRLCPPQSAGRVRALQDVGIKSSDWERRLKRAAAATA